MGILCKVVQVFGAPHCTGQPYSDDPLEVRELGSRGHQWNISVTRAKALGPPNRKRRLGPLTEGVGGSWWVSGSLSHSAPAPRSAPAAVIPVGF